MSYGIPACAPNQATCEQMQPRCESIADRLCEHIATLDSAVARVRTLGDRYIGPSPEASEKANGIQGPPTNLAARLESLVEQINSQINKLHDQISRIERF